MDIGKKAEGLKNSIKSALLYRDITVGELADFLNNSPDINRDASISTLRINIIEDEYTTKELTQEYNSIEIKPTEERFSDFKYKLNLAETIETNIEGD